MAYCVLLNIMRILYPGVHQGTVKYEDENQSMVPGQWRQGGNLQDMEEVTAGYRDFYLKHYDSSPVRHFMDCESSLSSVVYDYVCLKVFLKSVSFK